jgi:hypothetical protein
MNRSSSIQRLLTGAVTAALLTLGSATALAQVPGFVPVQGHLSNASGDAVDGEVDVVLNLYVDEGGGSLNEVWSAQRTVTVDQGSFSLYLGTEVDLDMSLFAENDQLLLGMAFDGDSEMPLIEIGTVPYAAYCQMAKEAETVAGLQPEELGPLGGLSCGEGQYATYQAGAWACANPLTETDVDQLLTDDGYLTSGDVATVATSGDFGDLTGTPTGLADGDDDTLASLSCSNGQVAQQTAAGWTCADMSADYTASAPIQISGSNISLAPNGVTGAYIAPETLTDGDVAPNAAIAPTKISGTAATLTGDQNFDGGTLAVDDSADSVGVGTTAPASKLHVAGDARVDGNFVYDAPRTGYVQVPASAFELSSATEDEEVSRSTYSGYLYISGGAAIYSVYMMAPLDLPHGATLTEASCYAYDNNSTVDLGADVDLMRSGMTSTSGLSLVNVDMDTTNLAQTTVQTSTATNILNPVVDNSQYNYWLNLYFSTGDTTGATLRFYGCRIAYETSQVLP